MAAEPRICNETFEFAVDVPINARVDLAFALDSTVSMNEEKDAVAEAIGDIVDSLESEIQKEFPDATLRLAESATRTYEIFEVVVSFLIAPSKQEDHVTTILRLITIHINFIRIGPSGGLRL